MRSLTHSPVPTAGPVYGSEQSLWAPEADRIPDVGDKNEHQLFI